jgi:hypothetical protein
MLVATSAGSNAAPFIAGGALEDPLEAAVFDTDEE